MTKFLDIDFEYKNTKEARLTLVSVAFTDGINKKSIWLYKDQDKQAKLKKVLLSYRDQGYIIRCWSYDAEGRSLISLGINPITWPCVDLNAEYKMLINHNDKLGYGKQVHNGRVIKTERLEYGAKKSKHKRYDKPKSNLLAATFKLLGIFSTKDYETKNKMRDLILKTEVYSETDKENILAYGLSDIEDLAAIYEAQIKHYKRLLTKTQFHDLTTHQLYRGDTVARSALIASIGYPVSREKVTNFTRNIPNIIKDIQEDINEQFPDMEVFKWNKKEKRYSQNTKAAKAWIAESPYREKWLQTATGDYSLALEAWEKHFSYRHDFPRGNFPAQYLRYLKTLQSLNGFKPKSVTAKNKDTFFSYYGSDDRAHPFLNSYGSQSARYQPKATGFLHLKASWMRSMVEPKPGRAIISIDYGSQEFLISALVSQDENMIKAYESGDVYLYFAKLAGAVPWDGKKEDYKIERDRFKATTLGISYGMGAQALADKLTMETGIKHTRQDAQDLIDKFYQAYPKYGEWAQEILYTYSEQNHIELPDGWMMFGDNDNARSVGNMPIQGLGSCILRKAIEFCQDAGLTVILPLHDALYIECDGNDVCDSLGRFEQNMRRAFTYYFEGEMGDKAESLIRLDHDIWGPEQKNKIYIDERSENEYKRFSKYFNK